MKAVNSLMIGFVVLVLAGCASTGASPRVPSGYIAETVDEQVPEGTVPAVVIEIDGQRALYGRGAHRVPAGVHTVSVWPATPGPRGATPIPGAHAAARGIRVESIEIDVKPGDRYYLAARIEKTRVVAVDGTTATALGPWRTTVVPVLIRDTES
jgi:hypothetical protein